MVVFPEGDVSPRQGGFHRPRTGAARLALLTGVPVVPVGIYLWRKYNCPIEMDIAGTRCVSYVCLRGKYALTVGEPVRYNDPGSHLGRAQMDLAWRVIDVLGILFTAAMTLVMLFTYRVPRRIAVLPLLLSTVLSLIALPVFVWLSGARLNLWLGVPAFLLGLGIGALRGLTTRLSYQDGQVVGTVLLQGGEAIAIGDAQCTVRADG